MAVIVRFISTRSGKQGVNVKIQERFLVFVKLDDSSGAGMTEVLLQKLNKMGLPLADVRGQHCDNAANLRGKTSGVQRQMREFLLNSFVPFSTHSLSLVLSNAAGNCTEGVNLLGVIQAIFIYFQSVCQWDIALKHIGHSGITVKQLPERRMESRVEAVRAMKY